MTARIDSTRSAADIDTTNDSPATIRPQHSSPGTAHNTAVNYPSTPGSSETQSSGPTTTKSMSAQIKEEVEARLAANTDYAEQKDLLSRMQARAEDFSLVERNAWGANDGILEWADIAMVAADPCRPDHVREAAQRLLNDPEVWRAFAKNDMKASTDDVYTAINDAKAGIKKIEVDTEAEVRVDLGAPVKGGTSGTDANSKGPAADTEAAGTKKDPVAAEIDQALPKPAPSTMGGLEGANENANNLLGWAENEMDRLNALLAKTDDPATQKQIENKMNQLTRRMQSITAMITQLATMMSNISKMYSDIAMNSVRNMK